MNLELPFPDADGSALDEYLARTDEALDALFLDEIAGVLRRIQAEKDAEPEPAAA